jgi:hypothetical protein
VLKPHHRLTILRNLHRIHELKLFRELVATYFERSERDVNDVPMDWEGAQAARARINRMLPRIVQVVAAAGITGPGGTGPVTDPGYALGRAEVLRQIFSARYGDGLEQEIFDLLDMAVGVYEASRYTALARTLNPVHYAATFVAWVMRGPRRLVSGIFFGRRASRLRADEVARLEAAAARIADAEGVLDTRLAALQDRQAQRNAEVARQLGELAERLDFTERMLAREGPPPGRLPAPKDGERTPV